ALREASCHRNRRRSRSGRAPRVIWRLSPTCTTTTYVRRPSHSTPCPSPRKSAALGGSPTLYTARTGRWLPRAPAPGVLSATPPPARTARGPPTRRPWRPRCTSRRTPAAAGSARSCTGPCSTPWRVRTCTARTRASPSPTRPPCACTNASGTAVPAPTVRWAASSAATGTWPGTRRSCRPPAAPGAPRRAPPPRGPPPGPAAPPQRPGPLAPPRQDPADTGLPSPGPTAAPGAPPGAVTRVPSPGAGGSAELHRPLGQPHPEPVDHGLLFPELTRGVRGAHGDEERGEVLGARVGELARRRLAGEVEQRVDVARVQRLLPPGVELGRPGGDAALPERGQVVGEEAGSDDQDALVAQRRQAAPDLHQLHGVEGRHGDLEDRDVSLGVHLDERDVRAVVEPAVGHVRHGHPGGAQQLADRLGQRRGAGGAVRHLVVVLGEAPEVVDEGDGLGRAEGEGGLLPVGGDDEDRLRAGQVGGPGGQLSGPDGVVGQGRGAVAEVDRGHAVLGGGGGHGDDSFRRWSGHRHMRLPLSGSASASGRHLL